MALHVAKIAGTQIRDAASVVGNIMITRDNVFPSDLATILCGAHASVTILMDDGRQLERTLEQHLASKDDVIVTSVRVPGQVKNEHFHSFRVALRSRNSHALLNSAFRTGRSVLTFEIEFESGG